MIHSYTLQIIYSDKRTGDTKTVISTGKAADSDPIFTKNGRESESIKLAVEDFNSKGIGQPNFTPATIEDIEIIEVQTVI